uniref:Kinesin motor domain-containing protein n=1 Tax=Glossina brevipalpis TaxID=37001 RepID=A0A1A9WCV4_9MUSC
MQRSALKLLRYGGKKLAYASTSINANSSRSHCIFLVDVLKYFPDGVIKRHSYKFCDLTGSEKVDKIGNFGSRLKEAQRINTSLMILGRCLEAANNTNDSKRKHIPFRDSKLMMLLQAALQGSEKLTILVNVKALDKYYEENANVLNFALIAKNIIFKSSVVNHLHEKNGKNICKNFKEEQESLRDDFLDTFHTVFVETEEEKQKLLQIQLQCQAQAYETMLASLTRKYKAEIENLEEGLERRN